MEREGISRRDFLKVAGAAASVAVLGVIANDVKGDTPSDLIPEYSFTPFSVPSELSKTNIGAETTIIEFPKPKTEPKLSKAEQRDAQIKKELSKIQKIMLEHPDIFSKKKVEDVKMYYPIYRAVADKYKIPWYLLFTVHEAETGASAGKRGFTPESYYIGAMQLDPQWTGSFMTGAAKGLKYLEKVPQRHKDDWENIATGGRILSRNFNRYKKLGKDKAVLNALLLYSADDQALKRFKTYQTYENLFPAGKKRKANTNTAFRRAS